MATAFKKVKNNAVTMCAAPITGVSTTLTIPTGHVTRLPSSGQFWLRLFNTADPENGTSYQTEKVLVTAGQGTSSLTVTRAVDGETPISCAAGDAVYLLVDAGHIEELQTAVNTNETSIATNTTNLTALTTRVTTLETLVSGSAVLGSTYTIAAVNGTWVDTGLSVSLPSAGTYVVTCDFRSVVQFSAGSFGWIVGKLYNSTTSADVANTERLGSFIIPTGQQAQGTTQTNSIITVSGATTIKLYVKRDGATTWTTSTINSDTTGRTVLSYFKIA